jgi:hypothetical protein
MDPNGQGCWSNVTSKGQRDVKIAFITAYKACDDQTAGPKMAYRLWTASERNIYASTSSTVYHA